MTPSNRTIFRAGALEGYMQARAQTVLPRFIAPPAPLCLWLLLGCFFSVSVLAWLTRVPVYRNGTATVAGAQEDEELVAFFPPEAKSEMSPGQTVSFKLEPDGPLLVRTISRIEPEIISPADARKRFQLDDATAKSYLRPSAVAIARLGKLDDKLSARAYQGIVVDARIQVGTQRLLELLIHKERRQ